jgi:hypothetical protein
LAFKRQLARRACDENVSIAQLALTFEDIELDE